MRADRLIAVLLLLQQREQVTASEVALELEVSERTARRDLEALSCAGVPVYAVPDRQGFFYQTITIDNTTMAQATRQWTTNGPETGGQ